MKFFNYKIANIIFSINFESHSLIYCRYDDKKDYNWRIIISIKEIINNESGYMYEVFVNNEIGYSFDNIQKIIHVDAINYDLFIRTFFTYPLQRICFLENSFLVHAAACSRNKSCLNLFMGECGVGKSTLCDCLKDQFSIISDDGIKVVLIDNKIYYYPTAPFIKIKKYNDKKDIIPIEDFNINYEFYNANIFVLERFESDYYRIKTVEDEYIKRLLLMKNIKNIFNKKLLKNTNNIKKIIEELLKCNMFLMFIPNDIKKLNKWETKLCEEILYWENSK